MSKADSVCFVAMLLVASQPLHSQSRSTLDAVAEAMGGKDRVLAVRTLVVEGSGELLYFNQAHTPYAKTNFTLTSVRTSYDFVNHQ